MAAAMHRPAGPRLRFASVKAIAPLVVFALLSGCEDRSAGIGDLALVDAGVREMGLDWSPPPPLNDMSDRGSWEQGTGCIACHGTQASPAPPIGLLGATSTTERTVGAHQEHLKTSTWRSSMPCASCHTVPKALVDKGHIDTALPAEVTFSSLAKSDGAAPAWSGTTCSGTYCHGATLSGGSNTKPVWTTVDGTQAKCGTCHGLPPTSGHTPNKQCSMCHKSVVDSAMKIIAPKLHINGKVELAGISACNACHGGSSNAAPPLSLDGKSSPALKQIGAHQPHLKASTWRASMPCVSCHTVPKALADKGHIDTALPAEVTFSSLAKSDSAAPAWSGTTCSGTYCHGATLSGGSNTKPVWTTVDGTQAKCGTCHGLPPTSGHTASKQCSMCHKSVVDSAMKIIAPKLHINGKVEADGGCTICHSTAQGSRRQIVGSGADFSATSHHVQGQIKDSDCVVCHSVSSHKQGTVRLKDVDTSTVYTFDANKPEGLAPFCLSCHDADGANGKSAPFSDGVKVPDIKGGVTGVSAWSSSAHATGKYKLNANKPVTCYGDGSTSGCHANGHGSKNIKLLAGATFGSSLQQQCYACHTEGKLTNMALVGSVNDIKEAFSQSRKHNLGTSFTVSGKTFTLQCTTCHNPHVATGKHWNVDKGVSPVTRPNLTADPKTNPRAMSTALWGAKVGQKMDDFAAKAKGSGGWYHSVARGRKIVMDQPGKYQPPKTSAGGWSFEFAGSALPDYTTLCLDCHTHRMSAANPPVNWGQGIKCTGNSVNPPGQRVECGAQHGLAAANRPSSWGNPYKYGNSGNPDPIFSQPGVQRGRGARHFMRWPYDSAHRNAGVNFVLSCTDCHESHGSSAARMLRTKVNAYGAGTHIWNTMCNNCHYYYGGHHAGMSCGNASCHEANSIHRIIHNTSSGGTYLWTETSKPSTTPELKSVVGYPGTDKLDAYFTQGVWTTANKSGALTAKDFLLTDVYGDNPRTLASVAHTAGSARATLTMSAKLKASDVKADLLAARGISVWDANGDPAGPYPMTIAGCPPPPVTFALNELPGSSTSSDSSGMLSGSVGAPSTAFQGSDGYFHGSPASGTWVDFTQNPRCLKADTALTLEARFFTGQVDQDFGNGSAPKACTSDYDCDAKGTMLCSCGKTTSAVRTARCPGNSGACDARSGLYTGCTANYQATCPSGQVCCSSQGETCWNNSGFCSAAGENATFNRIFDRKRTLMVSLMRADYAGDSSPGRANKAKVEVKYFVATASRHSCPHVSYPSDTTYTGADSPWHQVSTDIDKYPFVSKHWYRMRVVFDSSRATIPVNIWVDDQGTDGLGTGELWSGFTNIAKPKLEDSSSCRWGALPGDKIALEDQPVIIGAPQSHASSHIFEGLIDWVTWKDSADYQGVTGPPN